jgi:hypothetical protein
MGRGQTIELLEGTVWHLRAVGIAGAICPVTVYADMRRVALASPNRGACGLNGPDWAQVLYPTEKRRFIRSNYWILREQETDMAVATRSPRLLIANPAIPLSATSLALTLVSYSIPGESKLGVPQFRWGTHRSKCGPVNHLDAALASQIPSSGQVLNLSDWR